MSTHFSLHQLLTCYVGAHSIVISQELLFPRPNWRKSHQTPTTRGSDSVVEVMVFVPRDSKSDVEEVIYTCFPSATAVNILPSER